jgi:cysteine desulfurase
MFRTGTVKKVYLDYAASTPVLPEVERIMEPYWKEKFGNASSMHSFGRETRIAIEQSREKIARILNCLPQEIIFIPSTTTADNLAILGTVGVREKTSLITSSIEHHAVLDTFKYLEKQDHKVSYLPVDPQGRVDLKALEKALTSQTVLVSVMYANNEVGTIQPIKEISKLLKGKNLLFHTDAAATAGFLDLDVQKLGVDLLSLGAHKFGGPKGIGVLFIKKGIKLNPIILGGHHENGLWPGTEAVPLIVGMAKALEITSKNKNEDSDRITKFRDKLISGVLKQVPETILTGHPTQRLPDIASFVFKGVEGEAILLRLDAEEIAVSSGSACTSGDLRPSHVLLAMGIPQERAHGSIRFSLGRETTGEEIDYVLEKLPKVIFDLRQMTPKLN